MTPTVLSKLNISVSVIFMYANLNEECVGSFRKDVTSSRSFFKLRNDNKLYGPELIIEKEECIDLIAVSASLL